MFFTTVNNLNRTWHAVQGGGAGKIIHGYYISHVFYDMAAVWQTELEFWEYLPRGLEYIAGDTFSYSSSSRRRNRN